MKNWIMNFIADERGAESTEVAVTGVVIVAAAVSGFTTLKETLKEKQAAFEAQLDGTSVE